MRKVSVVALSAGMLAACATTPFRADGIGRQGPEVDGATKDAIESRGGGSNAMLSLAADMEADGNYGGAIPIYRHLAAGGNRDGKLGLARSLLATGNPDETLNALDGFNADGTGEGVGTANLLRGQALLSLGRFGAAADAFSKADGSGSALRGEGVARAALGQVDQAISLFDRDGSVKAQSNASLVLALTGRETEAAERLEAVARRGEAGPRERQNLALAYLAQQDYDRAQAVAQIDLDQAAARDTLTFYQTVLNLPIEDRMAAMITGVTRPDTTREEDGTLIVRDTEVARAAAERMVTVPEPPEPEPEPEPVVVEDPEPEPSRPPLPANAPKLLEPEGWALQIGAYRTIERLIRGWDILRGANLDILGDIEPRRSEIDFGEASMGPRGFYYRLNAGPLKTFEQADRICDELRARGTSCWIRPPEPSEGRLPSEE